MLIKPNLNKPVFQIFPETAELIKLGKCPMCKGDIKEEDFMSEINKDEYTISGMCQRCQTKVFK